MKTTSYLQIITILLLSYGASWAQNTSTGYYSTTISVAELKEDFQILRSSLEASHAGLYAYTSKAALDQQFDEIESSIKLPMTSIEFYRKIKPLLKSIGDGHTDFLIAEDFRSAINGELPLFPFAMYWKDNQLLVLRNLSHDESLVPGTIIKSINGESAKPLIQFMIDNMTRDAEITSAAEAKIFRDFAGYYAVLKGTPDFFDLEIEDSNGETRQVNIQGLKTAEMVSIGQKRYAEFYKRKNVPNGPPLSFELKDGVGLLTARSFSKPTIRKSGQDYKDFFKNTFEQIESQSVQQLILDLRNNGGGYPEVIIDLYRYLSDIPYVHELDAFTITKKLPNRKHYKHGFWENVDILKSLRLKKEGDIYRVTDKSVSKKSYPPANNRFEGELYVLVNPFSFSATSDLIGMLRNANRGICIGETPGGNPHRGTSWIMPVLVLPNSNLQAIIPLVHMKSKLAFDENKKGMIPDHVVKNSLDAEINGEDEVREFAMDLIKKGE